MVLLQMLCHFQSQASSSGVVEALLQDLELGNEKGNRLPGEMVSVLGMLPKAQGKVMVNRLLNVLVTGQGT